MSNVIDGNASETQFKRKKEVLIYTIITKVCIIKEAVQPTPSSRFECYQNSGTRLRFTDHSEYLNYILFIQKFNSKSQGCKIYLDNNRHLLFFKSQR